MEEKRKDAWNLVFEIIENNSDRIFLTTGYYNAKNKILNDNYKEVEADEFKFLYKALKSAENNTYHAGYTAIAYLCRRIGFHSDEEGLYEFSYLKDKYGGCYIATMVYGSYDAPEVIILRKFRDKFLERKKSDKCLLRFTTGIVQN